MSPTLLARLRRIEHVTRRLAAGPDQMGARYPRDYRRAAEMAAWRWMLAPTASSWPWPR